MIVSGDYNSEIRMYNKVLAPWADELTIQLLISNKSSEMILYEDGLSSYTFDIYDVRFNSDVPKWCKRLDIDINSLKPSKLILSGNIKPAYDKYKIESLNPIRDNTNLIRILNDIFNYKPNDLYIKNKYIYLTQPYARDYDLDNNEFDTLEKAEHQILDELSKCIGNFIIRPHPRDHERFSSNDKYLTDLEYNMWELLCLNSITADHVLIGAISTAQFTPKWWFDQEPWVIFTIKTLSGLRYNDLSLCAFAAIFSSYILNSPINRP